MRTSRATPDRDVDALLAARRDERRAARRARRRGSLRWWAIFALVATVALVVTAHLTHDVAERADMFAEKMRDQPGVSSVRVLPKSERPDHVDAVVDINRGAVVVSFDYRSTGKKSRIVRHTAVGPGASPPLLITIDAVAEQVDLP